MECKKFNLAQLSEQLANPWSPVDVERVGESAVRIAKFEGEYHWHKHDNTDELFIVFSGKINIQTRSGDIILERGEGVKIPKGVGRCPKAVAGLTSVGD